MIRYYVDVIRRVDGDLVTETTSLHKWNHGAKKKYHKDSSVSRIKLRFVDENGNLHVIDFGTWKSEAMTADAGVERILYD